MPAACGSVTGTRGALIEARLPFARIGEGVRVRRAAGALAARVVALAGGRAALAPFSACDGVACGDRVESDPAVLAVPLGTPLLGRAVDAGGAPLDGGPRPRGRAVPVTGAALPPAGRRLSSQPFWCGVRAIDGPLLFARGARVGVFGAPGAGKTTLLEAIVAGAQADAVVIALIGERAREAQRWLARADARTSLIVAGGERCAPERLRAAEVALAQADALRRRGLDVLLVVDSLARIGAAARDLALAVGEPAGRGGYPAGAFAALTRLLESAGCAERGSVTLVATVLAEGPEHDDILALQARAALDGHLVLSERLARAGRFPALDLTASTSRTLNDAASPAHRAAAGRLRAAVAALEDSREARALGLDPAAGDPFLARCVAAEPQIEAFLRQPPGPPASPSEALTALAALADRVE